MKIKENIAPSISLQNHRLSNDKTRSATGESRSATASNVNPTQTQCKTFFNLSSEPDNVQLQEFCRFT